MAMTPTDDRGDWTVDYEFWANGISWRVARVTLDERMGAPIIGTLRLVGGVHDDPSTLLGAATSLVMRQGDFDRTITGIVTRLEPLGRHSGLPHARIVLESRIGLARRSRRWRIFQEMTAPSIVNEVLGRLAGVEIESRLTRSCPPREYCVQHGEDDFTFVSRVLEDEGIAWRVEARGDAEVVVLVDSTDTFLGLEPSTAVETVGGPLGTRPPGLMGMMFSLRLSSPGVVQRDWDWPANPPCVREVTVSPPEDLPAGLSDWIGAVEAFPGRCHGADPAAQRAQDEYEALASRDRVARCDSDLLGISPGRFFEVELGDGQCQRMLVVGVRHLGSVPTADPLEHARDRGNEGQDPSYVNAFECVPLDGAYRPERLAERPRIHGLHTAVVVGPPNEEIHTDEHGRIRVRMHWDRSSTPDADASCWLRVAQSWAGQGWGSLFIPRVGMEVLVAFLDGDPDRPMCVGCVYNGAHRPPYELPADRTKSTIRTQSSPGGDGHNELTFEDAAGAEEVYVRAQRDLRTRVLRNESRDVGADQAIQVHRHQRVEVGGDQDITIEGNQTMIVHGTGQSGTAGSTAAIEGVLEVRVTKPGHVLLDAAASITLQCGASAIVIDPTSIRLVAGDGTVLSLRTDAVMVSASGAVAQIDQAIALRAAGGAVVQLDAAVEVTSVAGSTFELDHAAVLTAVGGGKLTLDQSALLEGLRVVASAIPGSALELGEDATLTGLGATRCVAGGPSGGAMNVDATGVGLQGTKVAVAATAIAEVLGKLVKIN